MLSGQLPIYTQERIINVLMHLLVLGAFFRTDAPEEMTLDRLNAPSGAGCFLSRVGMSADLGWMWS